MVCGAENWNSTSEYYLIKNLYPHINFWKCLSENITDAIGLIWKK